MIDTVHALATELRRIRVPVSTSDLVSAAESLAVIDLADRLVVREALAANLAKTREYRDAFDLLFDLYFATDASVRQRTLADLTDDELRRTLSLATAHSNRHLLREIAITAVDRFARIEPGRRVGGTLYILRTMQGLGIAPASDQAQSTGADSGIHAIARKSAERRAQKSTDLFERIVESEVRRRLVEDRGADEVAAVLRHPLPEDIDFLTASAKSIAQMNEALAPLGRQLSRAIAARSNSAPRRRFDVRRTMRSSLSHGGVPATLHFLPARPLKPQLVVLSDISGSVASFAAFALQLTYALRERFARMRAFVFADGVDEITDLLFETSSIAATTSRINREGRGMRVDGRSDYGAALAEFAENHLTTLDDRTIVLILGDARNNYRDPRADALSMIRARAGGVHWLNPEAEPLWNDGDAVIEEYAPHCDSVVECRTIRQLKNFIATLA